jgi:Tol biopolymer transport system component
LKKKIQLTILAVFVLLSTSVLTGVTFAMDKILFESTRAYTTTDESNAEIYIMNADCTGLTRLTNNFYYDGVPSCSVDGAIIVFESRRDGNSEIYSMNQSGGNQNNLTTNTAEDKSPSISRDGSTIVFISNRNDNQYDIYTMRSSDGGNLQRLTYDGNKLKPFWSPNGRQIVYESNNDIYVMNADGSGQTPLTTDSADDGWPAWSPNGAKIAFVSERDGNREVYIMDKNGGNQTKISCSINHDSYPAWSPDSQTVIFESMRDGDYEIYKMKQNGDFQTRLTLNSAYDKAPVWFNTLAMVNRPSDICASQLHTVCLDGYGHVFSWGCNTNGELGISWDMNNQLVPVQTGDLSNIIAVSADNEGAHNLALRNNGTVMAWGYNLYGQLGNNSTTTSFVPVKVSTLTDITAISAGCLTSLALKRNGHVYTWGCGQNLDGTDALTPVEIPELTDVAAVAGGVGYNIVLKKDGTVLYWTSPPTDLVDLGFANIKAISTGHSHILALKEDDTVWTWQNGPVQIKINSTEYLTDVKAISAGYLFSLALKNDGTVWAWGGNACGQLGINSTTDSDYPVQVTSLSSISITDISAGSNYSAAKDADGNIWTWGLNSYGQLGNNSTTDSLVPIELDPF